MSYSAQDTEVQAFEPPAEALKPQVPAVEPTYNPEVGVTFVLHAVGPTTLIAIPQDGGTPIGQWFDRMDVAGVTKWVRRTNDAGYNIYFQINSTRAGLNKKGRKDDIEFLCNIGIDGDAKDGHTYAGVLKAINNSLLPPTDIVMTGGGYQALWKMNRRRTRRRTRHGLRRSAGNSTSCCRPRQTVPVNGIASITSTASCACPTPGTTPTRKSVPLAGTYPRRMSTAAAAHATRLSS